MKSFIDHKQQLSEDNESIEPLDEQPNELVWKRWYQLINVTSKELNDSGNKSKSVPSILQKMIEQGDTYDNAKTKWLPNMWKVCRKNSTSITRIRAMRKRMIGNPFERDGKKTQWLKSLLVMGHDPRKTLKKVSI